MSRRTPEHTFQSWIDRLIDRIVLPPMFTTGIDHASQQTDNARARMQGRGIKFGIPDVFVAQWDDGACHSIWIELKRGSTLSERQEGVQRALIAAGQRAATCSTAPEVLQALRGAGFALHANADAIAAEYEMRVKAGEAALRTPRIPGKTRARRSSIAANGQWARIQRENLP